MSYQIKQKPEDFKVEEVMELKIEKNGKYSYYILEKTNFSTVRAIQKIADMLHVTRKYINFSGSKDKKAITKQYISIQSGPKRSFETPDLKLTYIGKGNKRINLGELKGNNFEIIVRNIKNLPEIKGKEKFLNLFGEQRFSTNNIEIGRKLLKRDFKGACELIDNEKLQNYLEKNPTDFIGALRQIDKKILSFYIHAYQSSIWNKIAKEYDDGKNRIIPIVGFDTELKGEIGKKIQEELKKDNLTQRSFIFRELPEITSAGSERKQYAEAKNLEIRKLENDEMNPGMKKIKLKFFLPKGCYATEFIKHIFFF